MSLDMPATSPATLPWGFQCDLESEHTGRTYRIFICPPAAPPPPQGYPVILVLDGNVQFATASAQAMQGVQWEGRPAALVVGIGYPDERSRSIHRQHDFTPSPPSDWSKALGGPWIEHATGEAEAFLAFLMEEVRPRLAAYGADPDNQTLMGFSLGGLFTLHVLFRHPLSFRTYVAQSPSIWFNHKEVLEGEPGFAAAVQAGAATPRVLITVGAWEEDPKAPHLPRRGAERRDRLAGMREVAMVRNARDLGGRLRELKGRSPYEAQFVLYRQETHLSVVPGSTSRGVAFALAR